MSNPFYASLLHKNSCFNETTTNYAYFTERHVQAIWFEQKNLLPLFTDNGEPITVISPGIWNTEAGPDFLKAHLRIGLKEFKGDIEIHLEEDSWYTHGHHLDARYNQVILHVSYWSSLNPKAIIKMNAEPVLAIALEKRLTSSQEDLLKLIDLELYPYKKFAEAGQCSHSLFNHLEKNKIHDLFKSAAYWRLEKKSEYLKIRTLHINMQLIAGIAMALGYKNNAESFLDLFFYLMPYRDLTEKELLAIAMGCCGFFDGRQSPHWENSAHYLMLKDLWWGRLPTILHQAHLRLDHIRPLNHPVRRLVYLTKLLGDWRLDALWDSMLKHWMSNCLNLGSTKQCGQLLKSLIQFIPAYDDHYWNTHFIFEAEERTKNLSLLGDNVRHEILINAFLPLLYATLLEKNDLLGLEKFRLFYQSLKSSGTSKGRYLQQRFFSNNSSVDLLNQAQVEQGAYQLHKDFCLHFEASCVGCPFVERYLEKNSSHY